MKLYSLKQIRKKKKKEIPYAKRHEITQECNWELRSAGS